MDTKLLLVKTVTLLYRESQRPENSINSADIAASVVDLVKVPDALIVNDFGRNPLISLRETARWMSTNSPTYIYDKNEFLQRVRVDCGHDESTYRAILDGCELDLPEAELMKLCVALRESVTEFVRRSEGCALLTKRYKQAIQNPQTVDWSTFWNELISEFEPYAKNTEGADEHPSVVSVVSFGDPESVKKMFTAASAEQTSEGMLKTGFQGINDMLGGNGMRRGESILVSALPHCYKSGFTRDIFVSTAIYNKPLLRNPNKKPLLLRFSFENPNEMDLMEIYISMAEYENQMKIDRATVDPLAATQYVIEKMAANGWYIDMVHIDPTSYNYRDLFNYMEKLEANGYEIVMLNMDYMNLMSKQGCTTGPMGSEIRDLYRRIRNFCAKRGTIFITPHQMSTEAMNLKREGVESLVQEVKGKGYYDSCKSIWQEADCEIYMDKVEDGADSYMEFQRGKHRGRVTPLEHLYCVYKFEQYGNIPFDVCGVSQARRSVGGKPISEGGGKSWHQAVRASLH